VEVTAQQGSRLTGGKWTRPDITVASSRTFPYVPGRHFDVITFEVKPQDQVNVTAIYEALAHLRAATRSYVLLHVPHFAKASLELIIEETCNEGKQHGIGVIIVEKPGDYDDSDTLKWPTSML
jgi:BarA-like signal transduction histidine kinase